MHAITQATFLRRSGLWAMLDLTESDVSYAVGGALVKVRQTDAESKMCGTPWN